MTSLRPHLRAFLLALPLLLALPAAVRSAELPDSTTTDAFRLANGLEVRVRRVPGAAGVAMSVAYRAGHAYDPAGREGLAALLAELEFTAPAGDIPERTREEMDGLRPQGWGLQVNDRLAVLTEIATRDRFPGVLHQVAARMRGVQPTAGDLTRALASVRADQGQRRLGRADLALYYRVRDLARGENDEQLLRRATARGLEGLALKDVNALLRRTFVPANACLAIAGDFGDMDLHALVEHEFGGIPAGAAQPEAAVAPLVPGRRSSPFLGLDQPIGTVGVIAPAVEDTLHPAFFLAMIISGPYVTNTLGRPAAPLTSRFQYSLFDEPDLVRFNLSPAAGETKPEVLHEQLSWLMDKLSETQLERGMFEAVRHNVLWLVGGPLPMSVREQMRRQPGSLGTLATGMASRTLWKGDAFWAEYLGRLQTTLRGHNTFAAWLTDPSHQAVLLLTPKR
ncbi:MAG: hypothetical protein U0704_07890 [Candidatus Eisenbacteria bacterium]